MPDFAENIIKNYGAKGKSWLDNLPTIASQLAELWHLRDLKVHENLSYNYVLDGFKHDQAIIVKIGIDPSSVRNECEALTAFQNHGVIKLLDADLGQGALLIERAMPGRTLKSLFPDSDVLAMDIACGMIDRLHRAPIPQHNHFPKIAEWLQVLDRDWNVPKQHLLLARTLRDTLLQSTDQEVLLHGDLHYDNILSNQDGWVVIDPKGVIGNPLYDKIGCLLREPLVELLQVKDISALLNARIKKISQYFTIDTQLILDWTYMQTVMAICWCLEDNQDPRKMLKFIEIISAIREPSGRIMRS